MNPQATDQSTQPLKADSPYLPRVGRITEKKVFTPAESWYRIGFEDGQGVEYQAGQFMEIGLFGIGEAPISICSAPGKRDDLEMCIRSVGDVTAALHKLGEGDTVGIRGPFGNGYDMSRVEGMDLIFAAGGLGLAPCRSFILEALNNRDKYGDITILYGARTPDDLLFTEDLQSWEERDDCKFLVTVDRADASWTGNSGVITTLFRKLGKVDPANTAAFIIGPPVMFKFTVLEALGLGLRKSNILCSLERRMKCGLGKCGHCQIRDVYVCQDGPIFDYGEVMRLREGI
jgi:NAD(P)H-flavin reductase